MIVENEKFDFFFNVGNIFVDRFFSFIYKLMDSFVFLIDINNRN